MSSAQEWEEVADELGLTGTGGHLLGTIGDRMVRVQQEPGKDGPQL